MVKRIVITGAAFVVALALGVVAVPTASAACYATREFKAGTHELPACGDPEKPAGSSTFIRISRLENMVEPGVWCGKVQIKETGNRETGECNTVAAAKKEFIEVLVPEGGGGGGAGGLPDIAVTLSGGAYPIHLQGTVSSAATTLGTASGAVLTGTGATLLMLTTELSSLGTFTADFTKVKNSSSAECHSSGDVAGVVLFGGEFHLVQVALSPLTQGALLLVSEFEIECTGGVDVLVRGNVLGSITGLGIESTELAELDSALEGSNGKQSISEYYNDGGTKIKAKLESEAGAGFVASDENVSEEIQLDVLGSQMLVVHNR
jgi:hypothetical protein